MKALPNEWRPIPITALKEELKDFDGWVLCGGQSVSLIVGQDTRSHGDTDIGVFRSALSQCLDTLGKDRVFLCRRNTHEAWDGNEVPQEVHDIWVLDRERKYWMLQVMVFDDEGDQVIYRRDHRIRWSKKNHSGMIQGFKVLNPFVTFLFKVNKPALEEKDIHDVRQLIEGYRKRSREIS